MGEVNKLLKIWNDRPLVQHVVNAAETTAAASGAGLVAVIVVTGHQAEQVEAILGDNIVVVHNPEFAAGMATSLRAGIAEADRLGADGAMILLGDMPLITADQIEAILRAHAAAGPNAIIQAACEGKPGNPVLFPKTMFAELMRVSGDKGARRVVGQHQDHVTFVELGPAASRDFDTPKAFRDDQL
jgi:molybdenum cofactor cytidylyltransferase